MTDPFRIPTPARFAFSGGRTSAWLLRRVQKAYRGRLPGDLIVTFANTGKEFEETLEFVREVERQWDIKIHWVEYQRTDGPAVKMKSGQPVIGCHGFRVVTFETASRKGEPFEAIIDVKADYRAEAKNECAILPNPTDRWCSSEMKARTMDRFMRSLDHDEYSVIVGIRADEAKRFKKLQANDTAKITHLCPMVGAGVVESDVLDFWSKQTFDLGLPHDPELGTFEGNCDGCFLKRAAKMNRLLVVRPEIFDWWADQERRTGQTFRRDRPDYTAMAARRVSLAMCEGDEDKEACFC